VNHVIVNMGHSVRERLKNLAKAGNRDVAWLFQRYAFERFYWRIGKSAYADRFILKGASLFTLWMGPMFRVTQDTDLESTMRPDLDGMKNVFAEIASLPLETDDGVRYDVASIETSEIKAQDDYKGVRVTFNAFIERARIPLQFDIGFGDSVYPRPRFAEYPVLLGGEKPRMKVYPQYTVVAEKVSAMIARGMDNSRLKDYFDIWALTETFPFDLALLATAMSRTLGRKGFSLAGEWPDGLTDAYAANAMKLSQWNAFLRKTLPQTRPDSLSAAVARIRAFLSPVVSGESRPGLVWSPQTKQWENGDTPHA
jgi:hypothetical protein